MVEKAFWHRFVRRQAPISLFDVHQRERPKAADYLKNEGAETAFAAFNAGGEWLDGDLYVFVVDDSGTWVASGARPELVRTKDDRPFIKDIVAVEDEGWVNYKFVSPADGEEHDKSSYIVRVGKNLVGAGAYKY